MLQIFESTGWRGPIIPEVRIGICMQLFDRLVVYRRRRDPSHGKRLRKPGNTQQERKSGLLVTF